MSELRVRVLFFSSWATGLQPAEAYLEHLPSRDLKSSVADPGNDELLRMARLDCDWDGECLRAFAALTWPGISFAPALIADARGLLQYVAEGSFSDALPWLVLIAQRPAEVAGPIGKLLPLFRAKGGRVLYYSYDDASHVMPCHATAIAPHLSVLIHDEEPLESGVVRALPDKCITRRSSWVANIVPFAHDFDESPERRIVFLGSKLGVTEHRLQQVRTLQQHFKDRFTCTTDHSVPVRERGRFSRAKVHLCPEGRKFSTRSMSRSHTDRPFWAGCLGQVPVSENSLWGVRLTDLVARGLVLSYAHGDLRSLIERCEEALELPVQRRREIYEHFNRHGTVGPVVAGEIARAHGLCGESLPLAAGVRA